ncbi:hypothetical protein [Rheinheimera sp. 4Y26]|uniref:hypothetical protein n=1 Tax=Rheinheimera sp. 4Y26 TaxID=2977811 RepID=UPI0021B14DFF|nr:hypothetical protein [Rheinheimera sp. 4Y26]MCT6698630.1 hypothetical protein [Rheinheimera sp. 4Y26]
MKKHVLSAGYIFALWLLLWLLPAGAATVQQVVYAWPASMQQDERGHYPVALLMLALSKAGGHYQPVPSAFVMSQYRTLKQLELGQGIDVAWTMTSPEREQQLKPVRIPIDRGLMGWRLLVIRQQDDARFRSLATAEQLKLLLTVQGIDWPDYQILKANGFAVSASNHFDGMYHMLRKGRVQYFPRSVTEIWPELAALSGPELSVASDWALNYPTASYFFVRHNDVELAAAIERGLELALADGSMQQLFLQHFSAVLQQADFTKRRVIQLTNPLLPAKTPLQRSELWFDPNKGY